MTLFCDLISGYPNRLTRWARKMFYQHWSCWSIAGSSGSWTVSSWASCPTARPRVPFPLPSQMICVTWTRGKEFNGEMIIIITLAQIFIADLLLSSIDISLWLWSQQTGPGVCQQGFLWKLFMHRSQSRRQEFHVKLHQTEGRFLSFIVTYFSHF